MIKAQYKDRQEVVNILTESFDDNKSVNYIVKQDKHRTRRIRSLMEYSFDVCCRFGNVFLSEDRKGCALILFPDKKRTTLSTIIWDLKLIINCTGLSNLTKTISRESKINKLHPDELLYYLWFIGVKRKEQGKGVGTDLLKEVISIGEGMNRTICLETSTAKNIPWYKKFGFTTYHELDLGYKLFFMKR